MVWISGRYPTIITNAGYYFARFANLTSGLSLDLTEHPVSGRSGENIAEENMQFIDLEEKTFIAAPLMNIEHWLGRMLPPPLFTPLMFDAG